MVEWWQIRIARPREITLAGAIVFGLRVRSAMGIAMPRPQGFDQFIRDEGFHSLYLVTTLRNSPVKVGIADDPFHRLAAHQASNFIELKLHRFWWMPGRRISERIESTFKHHFASRRIRGEWFDLPLPEAEAFVETTIRRLGTWGVSEDDVIKFMAERERQRFDFCSN